MRFQFNIKNSSCRLSVSLLYLRHRTSYRNAFAVVLTHLVFTFFKLFPFWVFFVKRWSNEKFDELNYSTKGLAHANWSIAFSNQSAYCGWVCYLSSIFELQLWIDKRRPVNSLSSHSSETETLSHIHRAKTIFFWKLRHCGCWLWRWPDNKSVPAGRLLLLSFDFHVLKYKQ